MGFLKSFSIDDSLLDGFVAGSDEDFELLISRHSTSLFNTAYYTTGSLDLAEEILLSVYCDAYRNVAQVSARTTVRYWFYRQVVAKILEQADISEAMNLSGQILVEYAKEEGYRGEILKALVALPIEYRLVFVLRDIMQFDKNEVAEILERDEVAVTAILHRSRLMLLRALDTIAPNEDFEETPLQNFTQALVERLTA